MLQSKDVIPYVPLLTGTVVVGGSILVAWLNNRWAERPRRLDLYKQIYPQRVKAATEFVEKANIAKSHFHACVNSNLKRVIQNQDLRNLSEELYLSSMALEWLFGKELIGLTQSFHNACIRVLDLSQQHQSAEQVQQSAKTMDACFSDIVNFFHRRTHISAFDGLFPP